MAEVINMVNKKGILKSIPFFILVVLSWNVFTHLGLKYSTYRLLLVTCYLLLVTKLSEHIFRDIHNTCVSGTDLCEMVLSLRKHLSDVEVA